MMVNRLFIAENYKDKLRQSRGRRYYSGWSGLWSINAEIAQLLSIGLELQPHARSVFGRNQQRLLISRDILGFDRLTSLIQVAHANSDSDDSLTLLPKPPTCGACRIGRAQQEDAPAFECDLFS